MNSRQRAVGSRQCINSGGVDFLPAARCPLPARRTGFTLIEVLVVIGIIVLLIALAVPALALISGSNSINGAENNLSAMLGRARSDAIALQKDTGILFFIDPATQGVMMAEVQATDGTAAGIQTMLDLVPDRDFIALPKGVGVQVIDNTMINSTTNARQDDAYIGFNVTPESTPPAASTTQFGGVILFDATGKLVSRSYAFRSQQPNGDATALFNLLYRGKAISDANNPVTETANFVPANNQPTPPNANALMRSAYGVILFDRDAFLNNGNWTDPQAQPAVTAYNTNGEPGEENWIDDNGTPLMVNRYNGTLVRGE